MARECSSTNACLNFLIIVPGGGGGGGGGGSEAVNISLALEEAIVAVLSFLPSRVVFLHLSLAFVVRRS